MRPEVILDLLGLSAGPVAGTEDVLGVYIFHRHGDRTAKAQPPVSMTNLGAAQAFSSGAFYRGRYVSSEADMHIRDLSSDIAVHSQLSVTAPVDPVLENSAIAFLQGLYPPNPELEIEADGSTIISPLGGYQYIPVEAVDTTTTTKKAESNAWLQSDSGCDNAMISSEQYFSSNEYKEMLDETQDFYNKLVPVVNSTMSEEEITFKNAYSIFDLVNVARIHNSSMPSGDLLDEETLHHLFSLASIHEWNLAYNSSDTIRAIAGSVLGGQIVDALELVVKEPDAHRPSLNIQFGTYGTFMSFFGLAGLPATDDDFYGIAEYASSMAFELLTNATSPTADDISVRFLFSNGTAAGGLQEYPLFGQEETVLPWHDFKKGMVAFSVDDDEHWCEMCGGTGGRCSPEGDKDSDPDDNKERWDDETGTFVEERQAHCKKQRMIFVSLLCGFIAVAAFILMEMAVLFLGGFRVVRKPVGWRQRVKSKFQKQHQPQINDVELQ